MSCVWESTDHHRLGRGIVAPGACSPLEGPSPEFEVACKPLVDVILLLPNERSAGPTQTRLHSAKEGAKCPPASPLAENLARAFLQIARCRGTNPALVTAEGAWSYRWLEAAARTVANRLLARRSFRPGDRVILLAGNSPEYVAAFYGILLAGGVTVPLPPDVDDDRLRYVLRTCESTLVISTPPVFRRRSVLHRTEAGIARSVVSLELPHPVRIPALPRGNPLALPCRAGEREPVRRSAADLAVILFTAGSTGQPKGVMLSHNNLLSNAWTISEYLHMTQNERPLVVLPLYHAFGNSILQSHLMAGATLLLDGSLAFPNSILDAIDRLGATSFSGVPEMYRILLTRSSLGQRRLESLRYMTVAGGALPAQQALDVARRIAPARFYVMYGQTEATARLSYLRPELLAERAGSIGNGLDGVTLEVVDEADRRVAPGQLGEIRARGPNILLGYWRDRKATARILRNRWLYTGDLAVTDADGFIYPQGRANALVKIAGHRVHPAEVEEFVMQRLPGTRAVAVAYETAAERTRLALFVQSSGNRQTLSVTEISRVCRDGLPRHKTPTYIEIVQAFPVNAGWKLDRLHLARRAAKWSGI